MSVSDRSVFEELERRRRAQEAAAETVRGIMAELFQHQVAVVENPARNKAILCPRRAGKTSLWVRYAVRTALERPGGIIRIWAVSRQRVKELLWTELKLLCARHRIAAEFNDTYLTAVFANRSEIRLLGADKDKEVQKKRGDKTVLEVVLESQSVGSYLRNLVEEVVEPCLLDNKGTLCLEGTPGPVCAGYWFYVTGGNDTSARWESKGAKDEKNELIGAGWSCHRWSLFDNPHLPHAREEVARIKAARHWGDDNPTYVREWLGRWVNDIGALFYKFDPVRNVYDTDKVQPWGSGWMHTLGWDLGSRDDMALVVWGWHPAHDKLYEAFSWKKPGALAKEVMEQITRLEEKGFNFTKMVADTGGGGRMYVEDVMSRYQKHFEAAEKTKKYEHVLLFNDDLALGQVQLAADSGYAREIVELARDPDWPPPDNQEARPREDPRCANHLSDAGLYAYRAAYHYLHTPTNPKPKRGTPEFAVREEKQLEEESQPKEDRAWWDFGNPYGDEDFD